MELHAGEGVLPGAAVVFEGDPSNSTLPSGTSSTASSGESSTIFSSSTSLMRRALARERVSSRNTLEMSIMEFITWST